MAMDNCMPYTDVAIERLVKSDSSDNNDPLVDHFMADFATQDVDLDKQRNKVFFAFLIGIITLVLVGLVFLTCFIYACLRCRRRCNPYKHHCEKRCQKIFRWIFGLFLLLLLACILYLLAQAILAVLRDSRREKKNEKQSSPQGRSIGKALIDDYGKFYKDTFRSADDIVFNSLGSTHADEEEVVNLNKKCGAPSTRENTIKTIKSMHQNIEDVCMEVILWNDFGRMFIRNITTFVIQSKAGRAFYRTLNLAEEDIQWMSMFTVIHSMDETLHLIDGILTQMNELYKTATLLSTQKSENVKRALQPYMDTVDEDFNERGQTLRKLSKTLSSDDNSVYFRSAGNNDADSTDYPPKPMWVLIFEWIFIVLTILIALVLLLALMKRFCGKPWNGEHSRGRKRVCCSQETGSLLFQAAFYLMCLLFLLAIIPIWWNFERGVGVYNGRCQKDTGQMGSALGDDAQADNGQNDNGKKGNSQKNDGQKDNDQKANAQADNDQKANAQADNGQKDNAQADSGQKDNGKKDNEQKGSGQKDNGKKDNEQKGSGQMDKRRKEYGQVGKPIMYNPITHHEVYGRSARENNYEEYDLIEARRKENDDIEYETIGEEEEEMADNYDTDDDTTTCPNREVELFLATNATDINNRIAPPDVKELAKVAASTYDMAPTMKKIKQNARFVDNNVLKELCNDFKIELEKADLSKIYNEIESFVNNKMVDTGKGEKMLALCNLNTLKKYVIDEFENHIISQLVTKITKQCNQIEETFPEGFRRYVAPCLETVEQIDKSFKENINDILNNTAKNLYEHFANGLQKYRRIAIEELGNVTTYRSSKENDECANYAHDKNSIWIPLLLILLLFLPLIPIAIYLSRLYSCRPTQTQDSCGNVEANLLCAIKERLYRRENKIHRKAALHIKPPCPSTPNIKQNKCCCCDVPTCEAKVMADVNKNSESLTTGLNSAAPPPPPSDEPQPSKSTIVGEQQCEPRCRRIKLKVKLKYITNQKT